jgi:methionine-rich copper-binding protein CopC
MATVVLDIEYRQSNDGKTLYFTDIAGTYNNPDNLTGWGDPSEPKEDVQKIVQSQDVVNDGNETHLLLDVTMTDKEGVVTVFDTINLYDQNGGGFTTAADLTWEFTVDDFLVSGSATMGDNEGDRLTDGIYEVVYQLVDNDDHGVVQVSLTERILVDGDVRYDVYNKLRQIPVDYDNEGVNTSPEIMEALLGYAILQSLEASSSVAMTEELVNILWTLNKLMSDGSHYTW